MNLNTKPRSEIYLVGTSCSQILGEKLPSIKQVLSVLFYNHKIAKMTIRESARLVIQETSSFWLKYRIPIRDKQHCIAKLEKIHKEWLLICKNKARRNPGQIAREHQFVESLDTLFDIAHANALDTMKDEVDKQFLINQRRKGRSSCIIGTDLKTLQQAKRKSEMLEAAGTRKQRAARRPKIEMVVVNSPDLSFGSGSGKKHSKDDTDTNLAVPSTSKATRIITKAKKQKNY